MSDIKELNNEELEDVAGGVMFYDDKVVTCRLCGKEFMITAGEQEYYAEIGEAEPDTCKECRNKPKPVSGGFESVCARCGKTIVLPFPPVDGRPVYCQECFRDMESQSGRRG